MLAVEEKSLMARVNEDLWSNNDGIRVVGLKQLVNWRSARVSLLELRVCQEWITYM